MSLALAALLATAAAPVADLATIDARVAAFTGAGIGHPGGAAQPVDRRLRLRACGSEPTLAWHTARRDTVVVQCPDAGGWRLFVPVSGGAAPAAQALPAVNRGDAVSIAVSGPGFSVSQPGEALEGGPAGAWIRARPLAAGNRPSEPMRARIVRPGLVEIPLP